MKKSNVILGAMLCAAALASTGCEKKNSATAAGPKEDASKKLVVWSFTDELEGMINDYYKPAHTDMTVEYSMTPTDQFPNKLDPVLQRVLVGRKRNSINMASLQTSKLRFS